MLHEYWPDRTQFAPYFAFGVLELRSQKKFIVFEMDKIPFAVTITLLVLALSIEVRENAGKGICSYIELQFSFLLYRIPSKEIGE